jgi:hypothetical protein
MRTPAALWELEDPRMTGPMTSLKILGAIAFIAGGILSGYPSLSGSLHSSRCRQTVPVKSEKAY